ncbi:MAG TPA: D-glycerate dehydrogenase [Acidimicrobiia bacterium]|nr:D-glycerate dehydrogenase [Acidimicrobiia bacterium]
MSEVYVTKRIPGLERLANYDIAVWDGDGPVPDEVLRAEARSVRGLLCMLTDRIDGELVDNAHALEIVSQMAVGVDNIDIEACARAGVKVGHTPDVLTETVADSAWALLGSIVRRLPEGEREVRAGEWGPWEVFHLAGGDLHRTTLGIVGMGRIGRAVARRAVGFDMEVIYTSPNSMPETGARQVELEELLDEADHVVVSARLDDTTRGLIGAEELSRMKPTAYLVNIARGPIVDTDALVVALRRGEIAGAALDVTDPEPLPGDHPLLMLDNCLVVPHIGSASVRTRTEMARLAIDNLIAGLDGRELPARYPGGG